MEERPVLQNLARHLLVLYEKAAENPIGIAPVHDRRGEHIGAEVTGRESLTAEPRTYSLLGLPLELREPCGKDFFVQQAAHLSPCQCSPHGVAGLRAGLLGIGTATDYVHARTPVAQP